MSDPTTAAFHFEAVKLMVRQSKDGVVIHLVIHPNELPVDLMMSPIGTRYVVAMAQVNDQGEAVQGPADRAGTQAVATAAMLCRSPKFQRWMHQRGHASQENEPAASAGLRDYCGIGSRADLKDNQTARRLFEALREEFQDASR